MGLVILLVFLTVQGAVVTMGGQLLMRPGLAVWREVLRDRKWRWLQGPLCFSPLMILLLGPVVLNAFFGPVLVWPRHAGWLAMPGILGPFLPSCDRGLLVLSAAEG